MPDLVAIARRAAEAGAETLRERFGTADLGAREKSCHDFVTEADRASEQAILEVLRPATPDHAILGEEGGWTGSADARYRWVVDPLDGTSNFMAGLPMWGVSVCALRDGRPVAGVTVDPVRDEVWEAEAGSGARRNGEAIRASRRSALDGAFLATGFPFKARGALDAYLAVFRDAFARARSIRRCGAAVLDLAYTASGVFDGFFEFRLAPWDLATGALLIEEAGGRVSDLDGGDGYLTTGNLVGGGAALHAELLAVARGHVSEAVLERLDPLDG